MLFRSLTNGGTLIVSNLAGTLAPGDSFKIFNAASYAGAFGNLAMPPLPAGLAWNTNALNTSGTLSVIVVASPSFGGISLSGTSLILSGTGGVASASYYVLASTNVTLPTLDWTRIATNSFDAAGNFTYTNVINPLSPQFFYRLQVP